MKYKVTWSQRLANDKNKITSMMSERMLSLIMILGYIIYDCLNVVDDKS